MVSCTPTAPLISDMEDGKFFYSSDGCQGSWFLSTSGGGTVTAGLAGGSTSGAVTPVTVSDNPPSTRAIHVARSGQQNTTATSFDGLAMLLASLNVDATHNGPTAGSLNATAYQGIMFRMKLTSGVAVHFQVSDLDTDPAGHRCTPSGATQCGDHAFAVLTPSTTWTLVQIPFTGLTMQEGFGMTTPLGVAFPKQQIFELAWKVMVPATGATPAWDLWVDDLALY
jgi:hypothetical protein